MSFEVMGNLHSIYVHESRQSLLQRSFAIAMPDAFANVQAE